MEKADLFRLPNFRLQLLVPARSPVQGAGIARLLSDLQPGYRVLVNLSNDGAPLPSPWTLEPLDAGYKVVDASGQVLGYVYGLDDSRDARIAKSLTRDEARRIASNIAKLPSLVSRRA